MIPGFFSLVIYRGDSASWQFILWNDRQKSEPLDLTNAAVAGEILNAFGGAQVTPLALTVTLPNIVAASLSSATTQAMTGAVWDLRITRPDGTVQTVLRGNVHIMASVSTPAAAPFSKLRAA